ncbi:MAG: hypothetical protein WCP60_06480 [bacterium]
MKTYIYSIIATSVLAYSALAAPKLQVDATIATGNNQILSKPTLIVENGKEASVTIGSQDSELKYTFTATLITGKRVDIRTVITQSSATKTNTLGTPEIITPLGSVSSIKTADLVLTTKTSLMN